MGYTGYSFIGADSSDRSGISVRSSGDFSADGLNDLLISARGGYGYLVASSDFAVLDAADGSVDGQISLAWITEGANSFVIDAGMQINNMASGGDINGDGRVDILIRSTDAYILSGTELSNADAADGLTDGVIALANIAGQTNSYHFAQNNNVNRVNQIGYGGDFNNDNLSDIVLAGQLIDGGGVNNSGGSYLISATDLAGADAADGVTDGAIHVDNIISQPDSYAFEGGTDVEGGYVIGSIGDIDGDSKDDFGLGALSADGDAGSAGESYILHAADIAAADAADGTADRVIALGNINVGTSYAFNGERDGDRAAFPSVAGDYNNDGTTDFAITADLGKDSGGTTVGFVYLISGTELDTADVADGVDDEIISVSNIEALTASYKVSAANDQDRLFFGGNADLDGDGTTDLLFNSSYADDSAEADVGASYLLMSSALASTDAADGATDGLVDVTHVAAQTGSYKIVGIGADDKTHGRFINDMNGDGLKDLAFGSYFSDINGDNAGTSWVLFTDKLVDIDAADGATDGVISLEYANTTVSDDTSSKADLVMMSADWSDTALGTTGKITATVDVQNAGDEAAYAKTTFFYSTDDQLDGNDIKLKSRGLGTLDGGEATTGLQNLGVKSIAKAAHTHASQTGDHYILAVVDADDRFTEGDEDNNLLAQEISIDWTGSKYDDPDLVLTSFELSETTVGATGKITASVNVTNTGGGSPYAKTTYYYSSDDEFDEHDIVLTSDGHGSLDYDADSGIQQAKLGLKKIGRAAEDHTIQTGEHFILAVVDAKGKIAEDDETNNASAIELTMVAPGQADLTFDELDIVDSTLFFEQDLEFQATVSNHGTDAGRAKIEYFLSEDDQLDGTDVRVRSDSAFNVNAGQTDSGKHFRLKYEKIANSLSDGSGYLIAVVDGNNRVDESDENNNVIAKAISFADPSPADLVITDAHLTNASLTDGEDFKVVLNVQNTGQVNTYGVKSTIYWNDDDSFEFATAIILDTDTHGKLAAGEEESGEKTLIRYEDVEDLGSGYIFAYISGRDEDLDTSNNLSDAMDLILL
jgi:subtilase family serine protease